MGLRVHPIFSEAPLLELSIPHPQPVLDGTRIGGATG